jgi:hypothetical protein
MMEPITLSQVKEGLEHMLRRLTEGCGDNGCVIKRYPVGTNGGCRCRPRGVARELRFLSEAIANNRDSMNWPEEAGGEAPAVSHSLADADGGGE